MKTWNMQTGAIALILIALLATVGCLSMGTKVDPDQLKKIEVGKTTEAEVADLLGKPDRFSEQPNGSRVLTWVQVEGTLSPIGTLSNHRSHGVSIVFRNGVVSQISKTGQGDSGSYTPPEK